MTDLGEHGPGSDVLGKDEDFLGEHGPGSDVLGKDEEANGMNSVAYDPTLLLRNFNKNQLGDGTSPDPQVSVTNRAGGVFAASDSEALKTVSQEKWSKAKDQLLEIHRQLDEEGDLDFKFLERSFSCAPLDDV